LSYAETLKEQSIVENATHYINTDLELLSTEDLTAVATAFEAQGMLCLHLACDESCDESSDKASDTQRWWRASFEAETEHAEPEASIAQMMTLIESLPPPLQALWINCYSRRFDIGYHCGNQPWAFNQTLSSQLLERISAAKAAVSITLYPAAHHPSVKP
jgi:hypothetical protein